MYCMINFVCREKHLARDIVWGQITFLHEIVLQAYFCSGDLCLMNKCNLIRIGIWHCQDLSHHKNKWLIKFKVGTVIIYLNTNKTTKMSFQVTK